jgi:anti-sigma regulatory factor (Ser/Thr protein kinase)
VARDVLLVDDMAHAHAYTHVRPQRVARRLHLTSDRSSIPRAIALIGSIGLEWDVPTGVIEDARRVIRELVDNATWHAQTASVLLQVSSDAAGLRVTVRDFDTGEIGAPRYGLGLVSSVATNWGVIRRSDGKLVWAILGDDPAS